MTRGSVASGVALFGVAISPIVIAATVGLERRLTAGVEGWLFPLGLGLSMLGMAVVGGAIVWRSPATRIGWLLLVIGVGTNLSLFAQPYATYATTHGLPAGRWAAWYTHWAEMLIALIPFVVLLFPTDRLPSRRWRLPTVAAAGLTTMLAASLALATGAMTGTELENPLGLVPAGGSWFAWAAGMGLLVLFAAAVVVNAVMRYRRARGVQRAQMRWLAAAVLLFATLLVPAPLALFFGARELAVGLAILAIPLIGFNGIAFAIGRAVLRYRVFEIDRVISRTAVYAIVTAVLAAGYVGSVLGLRFVLGPLAGDGDIAVAASTLLVAAAFRPLRRRTRTAVERRFHRSAYDARLTIESFGRSLRGQVDGGSITSDLVAAVDSAIQPSHAGVWVTRTGNAT